tara:strand:- start:740 stop:1594 length:855 start_codon:yes stop_codon:yes gene_type:complete
MAYIPMKALTFGAQRLFEEKVAYGKSRVSGSTDVSYILCSKAGIMPGQPEVFLINSLTKPNLGLPLLNNTILNSYHFKQSKWKQTIKGSKYFKDSIDGFTYNEYSPHDDEAYKLAVNASYRQIYGNFFAMESERPINSERRLRNGDITIKQFIRELAKSTFYRSHYFNQVTQQRSIELNFKHILGRPPLDQKEIISHIEILNLHGFDHHIDSLIDSNEYNEIYGTDIVPYPRCWNSPIGTKTSSFNNSAKLSKGFAISDNALNQKYFNPNSGASLIVKELAHAN